MMASNSLHRYPYDCFLSYAGQGQNRAVSLAGILNSKGHSVWIDTANLRAGSSPWPEIRNAIRKSRQTILLIDDDYLCNKGTLKEFQELMTEQETRNADSSGSPLREGAHFLIPVSFVSDRNRVKHAFPELNEKLVISADNRNWVQHALNSLNEPNNRKVLPAISIPEGAWRRSGTETFDGDLLHTGGILKLVRIAILRNGSASYVSEIEYGFRQEAERIASEYSLVLNIEAAAGNPARGSVACDETSNVLNELITRLNGSVDYLVPIGSGVTRHAISMDHNWPIIYIAVTESLDRQFLGEIKARKAKAEISGVSFGVGFRKRIEFIDRFFTHPGLRKVTVGLLYNPAFECDEYFAAQMQLEHGLLRPRFDLLLCPVETPSDFGGLDGRCDLFTGWYYVHQNFHSFVNQSTRPFIGAGTLDLKKGAVATIANPEAEIGRLAARTILKQHLEGTSLSEIRTVRPPDIIYGVHLTAAEKLNFKLHQDLVASAEIVFQETSTSGHHNVRSQFQ